MKRLGIYILLIAVFTTVLPVNISYALTEQQKLQQIQQQKKEEQKKLKEGKAEEKKLNTQINSLESQISSAQNQLNKLQQSIKETEQNILNVQKELKKVEAEMKTQNDNLNKRLRVMYKNGDASFLEILLGSESIIDFMSNMDMVQRIFDNDVALLKTIEKQYKQVEQQKKRLETLEAKLEADKADATMKRETLLSDKQNVAALKKEVAADNATLEKNLAALNREADKITAQILAMQNTNTQYTGGKLGWPLPGSPGSYRITSEFANRKNPVTGKAEKHLGLDVAAKSGTSVLAANSGTVIQAGYNSSYGYMVIIDHGGGIATLYAHNSRLAVSKGTAVSKGQTISYVGSTGMSTGPHLHFEVRVNGQYQNPRNWLF